VSHKLLTAFLLFFLSTILKSAAGVSFGTVNGHQNAITPNNDAERTDVSGIRRKLTTGPRCYTGEAPSDRPDASDFFCPVCSVSHRFHSPPAPEKRTTRVAVSTFQKKIAKGASVA
jgi:hypothetical protein